MPETARLELDGKVYELPTFVGSEGERAIDIAKLRDITGYITLDDGYGNTGSCRSAITYIDGDAGILRYRGIPIEDIGVAYDIRHATVEGGLSWPVTFQMIRPLIEVASKARDSLPKFAVSIDIRGGRLPPPQAIAREGITMGELGAWLEGIDLSRARTLESVRARLVA